MEDQNTQQKVEKVKVECSYCGAEVERCSGKEDLVCICRECKKIRLTANAIRAKTVAVARRRAHKKILVAELRAIQQAQPVVIVEVPAFTEEELAVMRTPGAPAEDEYKAWLLKKQERDSD